MRSGKQSWRRRGPPWRCCSGWCSGGRRRSPGRSRSPGAVTVIRPAAGTAGPGRGRSAGRGRGRGGGITRSCPGSRCSGISRAAGTAARSAGSRSRRWGSLVRGAAGLAGASSGWSRTAERRYKRECRCPGPGTVMAPGPPKAVGKGLFTNGFIAMLLTERFEAGRSMNSLVTGLARQGAEISPATLAGTCAQAGSAAGPAGGRDRGAEPGVVAPARRRDDVAGLRPRRRGRPGEMVAVGVHRPGHRVLRDGPVPVRGRSWPGTPASTRRPGSSPRTRTAGRGGW